MAFVYWRGGRFNKTSIASLVRVEKLCGHPLRVAQGGYNKGGVAASAGTHDGGGVVDISIRGWSPSVRNSVVAWLRRCGWAAWVRTPSQGFVWHIHAVRIGDKSASRGARAQVISYKNGRNGLRGNGRDTQTRQRYTTWEHSKYNPINVRIQTPAAVASKPVKTLIIAGKSYPEIAAVSVFYLNASRAQNGFSRHTYVVQTWLTRIGYPVTTQDGRWSPQTQAAFDKFRWDHHTELHITDQKGASGSIGLGSLTLLRILAKSSRTVREGK